MKDIMYYPFITFSLNTTCKLFFQKSTPLTTKPAVLTSDVPEKTQSGDNSLAIIIVICLLLVFSITGSILAYLFYRRKR